MKLGLFNETKEDLKIYEKSIKKVLKLALAKLRKKYVEFNIIFVDNEYIHELNKNFRGVDRETDVISFALLDDKTFPLDENILGDIYISYEKAYEQATSYGHSREREFCFLALHGLLHLLGYDHMTESDEKIMFSLQDEILEAAKILR